MIAILAQISIPIPFSPVPFTGQVLGVFLAGTLLGGKAGFISVLIYIILGVAGLPVFSMGRGGLQVILGHTGGYLLGLLPGTYLLGKLSERENKNKVAWQKIFGMGICLIWVYTLGALQLAYIMNYELWQALVAGVIPYIPLDIAKMGIAYILIKKIKHVEGQGWAKT